MDATKRKTKDQLTKIENPYSLLKLILRNLLLEKKTSRNSSAFQTDPTSEISAPPETFLPEVIFKIFCLRKFHDFFSAINCMKEDRQSAFKIL